MRELRARFRLNCKKRGMWSLLCFWVAVAAARARRWSRGLSVRRVFVVCECSQAVADACNLEGHIATSVDLKEGRGHSPHLVMDANTFLDMVAVGAVQCEVLVAHPPCTLLSRYAAVHYGRMGKGRVDRARALGLITRLLRCMKTVAEVYVENPAGSRMCKRFGPPDVVLSPWEFGANYDKPTG